LTTCHQIIHQSLILECLFPISCERHAIREDAGDVVRGLQWTSLPAPVRKHWMMVPMNRVPPQACLHCRHPEAWWLSMWFCTADIFTKFLDTGRRLIRLSPRLISFIRFLLR